MTVMPHTAASWDAGRWPNFTARELACRCADCGGEYWHDPVFLDALQRARTAFGAPFRVNSAHRCALHNARVGGAPLSMHKRIAADISVVGYSVDPRRALLACCRAAGFRGFGYYGTFLHVDMGRARSWFMGQSGRSTWGSIA